MFSQLFFTTTLKGRYFYLYPIDKVTELGEKIHLVPHKDRAQGWELNLGGLHTSKVYDRVHSSVMSPARGGV